MKILKKLKIYFMDVIFQIIPKNFHPYKLLILAGIDNNKPKLLIFILIKYLDIVLLMKMY